MSVNQKIRRDLTGMKFLSRLLFARANEKGGAIEDENCLVILRRKQLTVLSRERLRHVKARENT